MFWFKGSLVHIKYSVLNEIRHILNLYQDAFLFFKVYLQVSTIANFQLPNLIFLRQMIEKVYLLSDKICNFSSVSNKLSLDTTTISLVLLLCDFSSLNIDLCV